MKKLLLILITICACASQIFATCQSGFTWLQTSNNVISFTNTSTGTGPSPMYTWNFGDATYSSTVSPVHTYSIPGTYYVCLTLNDSMNCSNTFCDSIVVTGVLICNMTLTTMVTMASCSTCTDGSASVSASNATAPLTFAWSTVPPQTTSTATSLAPGTYTVCVTDANGCTACNSATVSVSTCLAGFTWIQTSNNHISFTNTSTGTGPYTYYHWTFGDNTASNTLNPTHNYSQPGTYTVCLQLSDSSSSCSNIFCDTVTVTGLNCNNLSLSASATAASCPSCTDGSAMATPSGGNPPFTYLWSTSAATQSISNLAPGVYTCCITDAVGCTACSNTYVDSLGGCHSYFTLSYVSPQVYNGVNLATGFPPLSYLWSWGDNTTSNTAYPTHTYSTAGYYLICLTITDSLGCYSTYCDSFNIVRMATPFSVITVNILPSGPTGISNVKSENYCSVFPNPVSDYLVVDYSLAASANTQIILCDMLGNTLRTFTDDMSDGKHMAVFDIINLKQGIYLLSLKSGQYSVTRQVAIVK